MGIEGLLDVGEYLFQIAFDKIRIVVGSNICQKKTP